jgi:Spy/CpxP family protein refolding chaperone
MKFSQKAWIPVALLVALVISLGAADSTWARGWGCMNANLTPEQSAKLFDLKQQFTNETAGLRKQMMVKQTELAKLWQNPTPDQNQVQAKQQEINALRDQLQAKRTAYWEQNRQLFPQGNLGPGCGRGMAMAPGHCNW